MISEPLIDSAELQVWDEWCNLGEHIGANLPVPNVTVEQTSLIKQYPDINWAFGLGVRAGQYRDKPV